MKKTFSLLVGISSFVFSLSILLIVTLFGWAITGPRDLTPYKTYIEEEANKGLNGNKISISKMVLEWEGWDQLIQLKANEVLILNSENNQLLKLPTVILKYNFMDLVSGEVIPNKVRLVNPRLDLSNFAFSGDEGGRSFSINDIKSNKLHIIEVQNGELTIPGASTPFWKIRSGNLKFKDGKIYSNAKLLNDKQMVDVYFRHNLDSSNYLNLNLSGFRSDNFSYYIPELKKYPFVLDGKVKSLQSKDSTRLDFDISQFAGHFSDKEILPEDVTITNGKLLGSYDVEKKHLALNWLQFDAKDITNIVLKGEVDNFESANLIGGFSQIKVEDMKKLWPKMAAPNAISWINEHLQGGYAEQGVAKVSIPPTAPQGQPQARENVNLVFKINGVNVNYSDKLLPVKNVMGKGKLTEDIFRVEAESGDLGNSKATNIVAELGLGNQSKAEISGKIDGDLKDIGDFYLKLAKGKKVFSNIADISGTAKTDLKVKFPLLQDLKLEDVDFDVKSDIKNASVKNLYGFANTTNTNLLLDVDSNNYAIKGTGNLSLIDGGSAVTFTDAPTNFEINSNRGKANISAQLDITSSEISAPSFGLSKPVGEAASADIVMENNLLSKIELKSKSVNVSATGALTKGYDELASLDIQNLKFGKTDLSAKVTKAPILNIALTAKELDAQPIIKMINEDKNDGADGIEFNLTAKVGKLYAAHEVVFNNMSANISCGKKECSNISLSDADLKAEITPSKMNIKSKDAGKMLSGFDIYDNMEKGNLEIDASGQNSVYKGKILVTDFAIRKAKILAKMLTLGSLTGIADAVTGNGITFKKLSSEFTKNKGKIEVNGYRMFGSAIGITADGYLDSHAGEVKVSGNIIPSYTANTLLGKIPLLGDIIIGDKGVFALAYKMDGKPEDPDLSVNPLSVLAPGFLKEIFQ